MGKMSLYHPVSLNVLHGAAELGGWKLGKLHQTKAERFLNKAEYDARILKTPIEMEDKSVLWWRSVLNTCFAQDVDITAVWITKSGKVMCHIVAQVYENPTL